MTIENSFGVKTIKEGEHFPVAVPFTSLSEGDTVFINGQPVLLADDAHLSGDSSYEGYLVYGRNTAGSTCSEELVGIFPEDCDTMEV